MSAEATQALDATACSTWVLSALGNGLHSSHYGVPGPVAIMGILGIESCFYLLWVQSIPYSLTLAVPCLTLTSQVTIYLSVP